jgi:hypothetical protein
MESKEINPEKSEGFPGLRPGNSPVPGRCKGISQGTDLGPLLIPPRAKSRRWGLRPKGAARFLTTFDSFGVFRVRGLFLSGGMGGSFECLVLSFK